MPYQIVPKKQCTTNGIYWVVSLGRRYTGERRRRHYFRSRKEAKTFAARSREAHHQLGFEAFILPLNLRAEALACCRRLQPLHATLTQAVEFFIENRPRREAAKPLPELKEEFLKSRRAMNCRPRTLVQYESHLRVICAEFGKTEVARILRADIEDWLEESDWSPRTRKNYLVTFTTLLNYAVGKQYRSDNPAAGIERPILDERPVGILTVEQAKALLRVTMASDSKLIHALAIGLFAGLRRSEFFALDWAEVDLESRIIEVKGIKAKTRQRRLVHVADNLLDWLTLHRRGQGPITPERNIDVFSERLRVLAQKAGIHPWPHNAMRHSFGSYFLAKTRDENRTASEMGNSPGVIMRHYRAVVRDAKVSEFWNITPSSVAQD
jgi:site-specific recombinase XerD